MRELPSQRHSTFIRLNTPPTRCTRLFWVWSIYSCLPLSPKSKQIAGARSQARSAQFNVVPCFLFVMLHLLVLVNIVYQVFIVNFLVFTPQQFLSRRQDKKDIVVWCVPTNRNNCERHVFLKTNNCCTETGNANAKKKERRNLQGMINEKSQTRPIYLSLTCQAFWSEHVPFGRWHWVVACRHRRRRPTPGLAPGRCLCPAAGFQLDTGNKNEISSWKNTCVHAVFVHWASNC